MPEVETKLVSQWLSVKMTSSLKFKMVEAAAIRDVSVGRLLRDFLQESGFSAYLDRIIRHGRKR